MTFQLLIILVVAYFGLYVLPMPLFASWSSSLAHKKGRSYPRWFMAAIFLGIFAPLILLCLPKVEGTELRAKYADDWTCPYCWHVNRVVDVSCAKCGKDKPIPRV